jgi:hypothetical protein
MLSRWCSRRPFEEARYGEQVYFFEHELATIDRVGMESAQQTQRVENRSPVIVAQRMLALRANRSR